MLSRSTAMAQLSYCELDERFSPQSNYVVRFDFHWIIIKGARILQNLVWVIGDRHFLSGKSLGHPTAGYNELIVLGLAYKSRKQRSLPINMQAQFWLVDKDY
jgi:hypothetical protein